MRQLIVLATLLLISAVPVQARECIMPSPSLDASTEKFGSYNALACAIAEINDLKRDQAQLLSDVKKLKRAVRDLPGEFRNEDGKVSKPEGKNVGSATFLLTARNGLGASSLPIDQAVLESVCATNGGCSVTLLFEVEGLRVSETTETIAIGPCALNYNKQSGAWSKGAGCGETGAQSGIDGDGSPVSGGGAEIIVSAGGACVFADADAARSVGNSGNALGVDSSRGLFLVTAPTLREKSGGRFRCELKIE